MDGDATAQFANLFVVHRFERTANKTVGQLNIANICDKARNTYQCVYLLTINHSRYFDFEIAVNLFGCVIKAVVNCCCHNFVFFPGTRPVGLLFCWCKVTPINLISKTFCIISYIFS